MDTQKDVIHMLELVDAPAFCAGDNRVLYANAAARGLMIQPGTGLDALISTGMEDYRAFDGGALLLMLTCCGLPRNAGVIRIGCMDVFVVEQDSELNALALAAREIRVLLSPVMSCLDSLPVQADRRARVSREKHRLLRTLGNMSDAGAWCHSCRQELVNITAVLEELFQKAQALLPSTQARLAYQGPEYPIFTLADPRQLERAVWNLLSNALKFLPPRGRINAALTRRGRMLRLSIQDNGSGIAQEVMPSLFRRYLRSPTLEDCRHGIGLGMALVRFAAVNHGGTVLIQQPQEGGTRVTMTIAIRQCSDSLPRAASAQADPWGGWDAALVELSDFLPPELYQD